MKTIKDVMKDLDMLQLKIISLEKQINYLEETIQAVKGYTIMVETLTNGTAVEWGE